METNDQRKNAGKESENASAAQDQRGAFKKEDMLDLAKGAAAMDKLDLPREKIEGRTVGGAGGGSGTGDTGGDFDRPGTEGTPAINDYVSPEGLAEPATNEPTDEGTGTSGLTVTDLDEDLSSTTTGEEASGYPGGGAVRTAEDRLPPGETDENTGFSPESPLNK